MLQKIHDKAKGWVAYAIVFFISIPFALWGINSYFEGGSSVIVATVNGEEIEQRQVQNQLLELKQRMPQLGAGNDDFLKGMALDNLINQTLLRQQVEALNLRASPQQVVDTIAAIPAFQTDGKFDPAKYNQLLTSQRRNPAEFETMVRQDLTQNQLQQSMALTGFVPLAEADQYQVLSKQTRDAQSFTLKAESFKAQVKLSDEQINEYYEKNKSRYLTDEKVKLAYVTLDRDALKAAVTVDEGLLQSYYDENADSYVKPEERVASHILVAVEDFGDEAKAKAAKDKADRIYADIVAGSKTFEAAVQGDSDDTLTKDQNGSLGTIIAGDFDAAFEKAVFETEVGVVSEPVKTEAGYEIVRVDNITPAVQKTFAEVKEAVENDYRLSQADQTFLDQSDRLRTLAFESSGDLAPAADALGLKVLETDFITAAQGEGIGATPAIREAAFSEDVKSGKNSEMVEITETQVAVVRQIERQMPKQKPLAEVKDSIVEALTNEEARKMAATKGEALLKQVQTDNAWSAVTAQSLGTEADIQKHEQLKRGGAGLPRAAAEKLFAMSQPTEGASTWGSATTPNGDVVLLQLTAVQDGEAEENLDQVQQYGRVIANREVAAMMQAMKAEAEIERFPDKL